MSTFGTSRLAGLGIRASSKVAGNTWDVDGTKSLSPKYPSHLGMGAPPAAKHKQKRVRVTATIGQGGVKTYAVEELSDSEEDVPSPPLSIRRIPLTSLRLDSETTLVSRHSQARSPSPAASAYESLSPPGAPRIPFPPSPTISTSSVFASANSSPTALYPLLPKHAGLGLALPDWVRGKKQSTIISSAEDEQTYNHIFSDPQCTVMTGAGLGIMTDDGPLRVESGSTVEEAEADMAKRFAPFEVSEDGEESDEESDTEAHYHLPSDLFASEMAMGGLEFKASVKKWSERRQRATSCAV